MEIKTAVIPVAGRGTRFLPVTRVVAKELLPLVDTPIIHHIVLEAARAGIERIVLITSKGKTGLVDYFDTEQVEDDLLRNIDIIAVRQNVARGLGHAVLCARPIVGNEPFAVLLGDDVIDSKVSVTQQLIEVSRKHEGAPVVGVMEVSEEDTSKYGIVGGKEVSPGTLLLDKLVEKPKPEAAPSRLAIPGRYILTPDIFDFLENAKPGVKDEIQLTDSLQALAKKRKMYAYRFEGRRFDAGDKFGYLEANLYYAMKRPELRDRAKRLVSDLAEELRT
ncbi:MAG TPA: UTP--glucose-1-phosphate uridylyltransferase [Bdellovibrionota bacterium]|jgi:UTP--glucose-1-phosphate uridylyltransferase